MNTQHDRIHILYNMCSLLRDLCAILGTTETGILFAENGQPFIIKSYVKRLFDHLFRQRRHEEIISMQRLLGFIWFLVVRLPDVAIFKTLISLGYPIVCEKSHLVMSILGTLGETENREERLAKIQMLEIVTVEESVWQDFDEKYQFLNLLNHLVYVKDPEMDQILEKCLKLNIVKERFLDKCDIGGGDPPFCTALKHKNSLRRLRLFLKHGASFLNQGKDSTKFYEELLSQDYLHGKNESLQFALECANSRRLPSLWGDPNYPFDIEDVEFEKELKCSNLVPYTLDPIPHHLNTNHLTQSCFMTYGCAECGGLETLRSICMQGQRFPSCAPHWDTFSPARILAIWFNAGSVLRRFVLFQRCKMWQEVDSWRSYIGRVGEEVCFHLDAYKYLNLDEAQILSLKDSCILQCLIRVVQNNRSSTLHDEIRKDELRRYEILPETLFYEYSTALNDVILFASIYYWKADPFSPTLGGTDKG